MEEDDAVVGDSGGASVFVCGVARVVGVKSGDVKDVVQLLRCDVQLSPRSPSLASLFLSFLLSSSLASLSLALLLRPLLLSLCFDDLVPLVPTSFV